MLTDDVPMHAAKNAVYFAKWYTLGGRNKVVHLRQKNHAY